VVLGLAAAAVEILVQRARCAAGEVGDDKARIGALGAGLDAGDDALNPAPTGGAVVELLVAPQLIRSPATTSRSLPSSTTGLPQLPGSPFRHAVPTTPMDRNRCVCRLLPCSTWAFPEIQAGRRP
jgi:hypothetical protein